MILIVMLTNVPIAGILSYCTWYCIDLYILAEFRDAKRKEALAQELELNKIKEQQKIAEIQEKISSGKLKRQIRKKNKRR